MIPAILQFVRFCLVGLINTIIGLSVILGLMHLFDLHPVLANMSGYAAGLCFSFYANGRWTFRQRPSRAAGLRFMLAFGVSYLANIGVLLLCLGYTDIPPTFAQILAMITYTATFFLLCKIYVFAAAGITASKP